MPVGEPRRRLRLARSSWRLLIPRMSSTSTIQTIWQTLTNSIGGSVRVMVDNRDPWPHPWAKFLPESWELVREKLDTGDVVLSALPAFNCANTPALAALEKLLTLVASASHVVRPLQQILASVSKPSRTSATKLHQHQDVFYRTDSLCRVNFRRPKLDQISTTVDNRNSCLR
jgi:hypothetical protein